MGAVMWGRLSVAFGVNVAKRNCTMPAEISGRPSADIIVAIGWVLLAGVLSQTLPSVDFPVVLFGFVLAEISSSLLVIGLSKLSDAKALSRSWEDTVGHLALRWVVVVISTLILIQIYVIVIFEYHDYALICILGICLILALIKLVCACQLGRHRLVPFVAQSRFILFAVGVIGFAKITPLNADIVLSLAMALLLIVLLMVSFRAKLGGDMRQNIKPAVTQSEQTLAAATDFLFRYTDVLLIALILSPPHILIYLFARGVAGVVPLNLDLLGGRVFDTLTSVYQMGDHRNFVAVAARTNLGFLLIGGSASLIALSVGNYVPTFFDIESDVFQGVLFWLLVAEAAPALFGATRILLNVSGCERESMFLSLAGFLTIWAASNLLGVSDPVQLAKLVACMKILIAAVAAILLGVRFGIWPGLTALFFRQIRLL